MLQSGNWLIKVLGGGDGVLPSSFFKLSAGVVKPTEVPFILGGAWALALTCKPLEEDFDLIPAKLADPRFLVLVAESVDGEETGKKEEVAAVATILNAGWTTDQGSVSWYRKNISHAIMQLKNYKNQFIHQRNQVSRKAHHNKTKY